MNINMFRININDVKKKEKTYYIDNQSEIIQYLNNELNDITILKIKSELILSLIKQGKAKLNLTMQVRLKQQCVVTGQDVISNIDEECTLYYVMQTDEFEEDMLEIDLDKQDEVDTIYLTHPYEINLLHSIYENILLSVDMYPKADNIQDIDDAEETVQSDETTNKYNPFTNLKDL